MNHEHVDNDDINYESGRITVGGTSRGKKATQILPFDNLLSSLERERDFI